MYRRNALCVFIALILLISAGPLWAQRKTTIKLASLVPENTPWGVALNRMAAEWSQITNGEVELVIYHNGVAGDEGEVLRKLRLNQIQAAIFTSSGLSAVTPDVMALSYPLLIRDDAELDAVLSQVRGELDQKMEQNGFVTLAWAKAGWVKIFSKAVVQTPNDLRKQKLGTNPEDEKMIQAFKAMGFQMVPIHLNDVLVALNSGMVDAIYQSPVAVAANQYFGITKNMSTLNLAPFMGGILMNQTAWRRVPDKYRSQLLASCKRVEAEVSSSISQLEAEAISTMVRYGLTINQPGPAQMQEWYDDLSRFERDLVGPIFNRDLYQKISAVLVDYRRNN